MRVYRRLEARGEIRGGRFVAGLSGEQFALPDAIALMRRCAAGRSTACWSALAAADPANLLGTVMPGAKVARVAGARVLYRDGVPLATSVGQQIEWLADVEATTRPLLRRALQAELGGSPVTGPSARQLPVSASHSS